MGRFLNIQLKTFLWKIYVLSFIEKCLVWHSLFRELASQFLQFISILCDYSYCVVRLPWSVTVAVRVEYLWKRLSKLAHDYGKSFSLKCALLCFMYVLKCAQCFFQTCDYFKKAASSPPRVLISLIVWFLRSYLC